AKKARAVSGREGARRHDHSRQLAQTRNFHRRPNRRGRSRGGAGPAFAEGVRSMRNKGRSTISAAIAPEKARHTLMGMALGLGLSFALALIDSSAIAKLIAHSSEPKTTMLTIVSYFTLAIAVGATLTGFVFTMMEKR